MIYVGICVELSSSSAESMKHCSKICEDLVQFLKSDQNEVDPSVGIYIYMLWVGECIGEGFI